jgi:nitrite reductase/ring-hydroxylating ferredoxin subunit
MWGITAGKPAKDFMTITKKNKRHNDSALLPMVFFFLIISCQPDVSDDPIPFAAFAPFTINLNLPEYQGLRTNGYTEIDDIGVRGVIIYRVDSDTYVAYERNCSFQPNEACATVDIHISGLYMTDPCCNSTFDFATGNPTGGPAWRPLRQYETSFTGTDLTITDVSVNGI